MNNEKQELYVLQSNGQRLGPVAKDEVVRAIVDGKMHRDALVAIPGSQQWSHASRLPEVAVAIEALIRTRSTPPPASSEAQTVVIPGRAAIANIEVAAPQAAPKTEAQAKPAAEPKKDDKPKWSPWLPLAIFAAFTVVGVLEVAIFGIRALRGG